MKQHATTRRVPLQLLASALLLSACTSIQSRWYVAPDETKDDSSIVYVAVMNQGKKPISITSVRLCYSVLNDEDCQIFFDSSNDNSFVTIDPSQFSVWSGKPIPAPPACRLPILAKIKYSVGRNEPATYEDWFDGTLPNALPSAWINECIQPKPQPREEKPKPAATPTD